MIPKNRNQLRAWLKGSVYYPCSGFDGCAVESLGTRFQRFLHSDYGCSIDEFHDQCQKRNTFLGYRLSEFTELRPEDLLERSWNDIAERYHSVVAELPFPEQLLNAFVAGARFERKDSFDQTHGPDAFELLHVGYEAVTTLSCFYFENEVMPKCLFYKCPGIGYGGNYQTYPLYLSECITQSGLELPEYVFCDDDATDSRNGAFFPLLENYEKPNLLRRRRRNRSLSTTFGLKERLRI